MIASRFATSGLLADDAMGFIGTLLQTLKRRHYRPHDKAASSDSPDVSV
jgi:type I restriction enzyme R subunit